MKRNGTLRVSLYITPKVSDSIVKYVGIFHSNCVSEVTLSVLLLTYVIDDKQEYSPPPSVRTVHKKRRTSVQGRNSFTTPRYTQKTRNAVNSRSRRDSSYSYAPKQNRYSLALQESLKFGMYSLLFTTPTEVHLPLIRSALTVYKEAGSVLDLLYQLRI